MEALTADVICTAPTYLTILTMLQANTRIKITGMLTTFKHLNDVEGVISHYNSAKEKYAVYLPSGKMMVKEENMVIIKEPNLIDGASSSFGSVFRSEEAMMQGLKNMGMSEEQLSDLTPEQRKAMLSMTMRSDIVEKAANKPGVIAMELKSERDGLYFWNDVKTHVYLEMKLNDEKIEGGGGVHCNLEEDSIHIKAVNSGKILLQGPLFQSIDTKKCIWEVVEDKLKVTLVKATPMRWVSVFRE